MGPDEIVRCNCRRWGAGVPEMDGGAEAGFGGPVRSLRPCIRTQQLPPAWLLGIGLHRPDRAEPASTPLR